MIQQSDIIRRAYDKSIKKSTNDILIKQKNTIDDIDKKIKVLEEQNNKLNKLKSHDYFIHLNNENTYQPILITTFNNHSMCLL